MNRIKARLSLLVPFGILLGVDAGLTLFFQPAEYWHNHSVLREGNPLFAKMLASGPFAYLGAVGLHWLFWSGLMVFLPRLIALGCGTALIYGHSVGALGWLRAFVFRAHWNNYLYYAVITYLLIWAISEQILPRIKSTRSQPGAAPNGGSVARVAHL
jgi:hypothetical protein